jgi:hypothetical protein
MTSKIKAWDAYRAGLMTLPPGYRLEYDADVLLLCRNDGSAVAAFSARGAAPSTLLRAAEDDYRVNSKHSA